jgi:uncharacterized membrane protein required for colicin V production
MNSAPGFVIWVVSVVTGICAVICAATLARYCIEVYPREFKIEVFAVLLGGLLVLLAVLFFMWSV